MLRSEFDDEFHLFLRHYGYQPAHEKNVQHCDAWYGTLSKKYSLNEIRKVLTDMHEKDFAHTDGKTRIYLPQLGRAMSMLRNLRRPGSGEAHNGPVCDLCRGGGTVSLHRTTIGKYVTYSTLLRIPGCAENISVALACSCREGDRWADGLDDGRGTTVPGLMRYSIDVMDQGLERRADEVVDGDEHGLDNSETGSEVAARVRAMLTSRPMDRKNNQREH